MNTRRTNRGFVDMLHIYNGDSAAGTAKNSTLPGEHLAWREALVCGPTPSGLSEEEFWRVRAKHLGHAYGVNIEESEKQLREQEESLARFSDHEEVVLWFEHDLFCQIHLIYLLNGFAQRELSETKLSLICVDSFPGIEDFRGLGQLNEEQLASLFPQRREVTESHFKLGRKAWQAYSSPNPREIETLLASDTSALPSLKSALIKHLQRFPSVRNGLGRIENLGLEIIAAGHKEFGELFGEFGNGEPTYGFGDAQLFVELKRLASTREPLLTMSNAAAATALDSAQLLNSSFQITERGAAVMRGDDDFIRTNGIDLWLGGVHLEGVEAAWRWDENRGRLMTQ